VINAARARTHTHTHTHTHTRARKEINYCLLRGPSEIHKDPRGKLNLLQQRCQNLKSRLKHSPSSSMRYP